MVGVAEHDCWITDRFSNSKKGKGLQMTEHAVEIVGGLTAILTALVGILWYLVRKKFEDIDCRLDRQEAKMLDVEKEIQGVTLNYTKKFDGVHQALAAMQAVIVDRIHELELAMVSQRKPTTKRRSK